MIGGKKHKSPKCSASKATHKVTRCEAKTHDGKRCKHKTTHGKYCGHHRH